MLITNSSDVNLGLPWARKASVLLLVAQKALVNLKEHVEAYGVCGKAINDCWTWLIDREAVAPGDLAYYVDSDEVQLGCLDELKFEKGSIEQGSLIFTLMVVGYFANKAYIISGIPKQMSEPICETNDYMFPEFLEFADLLGYKEFLISHLS